MENVPKIVQERLQRARASDAHPDADLLTAFAEQSLAGRERDEVLHHLAQCGDCREVVALALPATESVEIPGSAHHTQSGWMTWPVLRWGVVAAGILVVASAGVVAYHQRQQNKTLVAANLRSAAQTGAQSVPLTPSVSAPQPVASEPAMAVHRQSNQPTTGREKKQTSASSLPVGEPVSTAKAIFPNRARGGGNFQGSAAGSRSVDNGIGSGAGQAVTVEAPSANNIYAAQAAPGPLHGDQAEVARAKAPPKEAMAFDLAPSPPLHTDPIPPRSVSGPRWTISANGTLQRSLDGGQTWVEISVNSNPGPIAMGMHTANTAISHERGRTAYGSLAGIVTDATGAVITGAVVTVTNMSTAEMRTQSTGGDGRYTFADMPPGHYRIDIEMQGFKTLTESTVAVDAQQNERFDAKLQIGEASTVVEVTGAAPTVQTETSSLGNAEPARKGLAKQQQQDKTNEAKGHSNRLATPSPVFHALAASGLEVWAGGSAGALYHSVDGGNRWTRIVPSAAGVTLTGDVTAVEFSDSQHGRIVTSAPEVWTTSDDGQSWSKQQ